MDEVNDFYYYPFKYPAVNDCRFCSVYALRVVSFLIIKALDMMMDDVVRTDMLNVQYRNSGIKLKLRL